MSVLDEDGAEVFAQPVERQRVISEPVAFQMVTMLRDVVDTGTATASTLTAGTVAGTVQVTASATGLSVSTFTLTVLPGPASTITT